MKFYEPFSILYLVHVVAVRGLSTRREKAGSDSTYGSSFLRAWRAISQPVAWGYLHDVPSTLALGSGGARPLQNYSETEKETQTWSKRKGKRKDVYSPENPGEETVDDWCAQPEVFDPACSANPISISLEEEINLVMQHLMCRLKKTSACANSNSNSKPRDAAKKKQRQPSEESEQRSAKEKKTQPSSESQQDAVNKKKAQPGSESQQDAAKEKQTQPSSDSEQAGPKVKQAGDETQKEEPSKVGQTQPSSESEQDGPKVKQAGDDETQKEEPSKVANERELPETILKKFREKVEEKVGDSDESFKAFDKDKNGEIAPVEFKAGCAVAELRDEECNDLLTYMADGSENVTEQAYKNMMGVTSCEIARRVQHESSSASEAYDAGDSDKDGTLSRDEFEKQCSDKVAEESCKKLMQEMSIERAVSRDAYEEWMQSCDLLVPTTIDQAVAPAAATRGSAVAPSPMAVPPLAPAPAGYLGMAPAPMPAQADEQPVTPESASKKVLEDVEKLKNLTEKYKDENKLDPELGGALEDMIEKGTDVGNRLKDISKLGPKEEREAVEDLVDKADKVGDAVFKFQTEVHPHGYKWWRFRWEYAFVEANLLNGLVLATMLLYMLIHWLQTHMSTFSLVVHTAGFSVTHLYHMIFWRSMLELAVLGFVAFIIWALEECGVFFWFARFLPAHPVPTIIDIGGGDMGHWPTTDQHVIYTLRSVNMHLFLAMLLYYLLMYHILLGAISILQQFMRHESPDFYQRFIEQGVDCDELAESSLELRARAKACHTAFTRKWLLGRTLSSDSTFKAIFGCFHQAQDFDSLRDRVAKQLKHYEGFKDLSRLVPHTPIYPYLARRLCTYLEFMIHIDWRVWLLVQCVLVVQTLVHFCFHIAVIELLPFNIAIGIFLLGFQFFWTRRRVSQLVNATKGTKGKTKKSSDDRKRISMAVTASINPWMSEGSGGRRSHIDASETGSGVKRMSTRHGGIDSQNATAFLSEAPSAYDSTAEDVDNQPLDHRERFLLWVQQLNFFFLCFAAARLIFSSFFWRDYFILSCFLLGVFLLTYVTFVLLGSLTVPMFIVMLSVPPFMSEQDQEDMKALLEAERDDLEEIDELSDEDDSGLPAPDSPSGRKPLSRLVV